MYTKEFMNETATKANAAIAAAIEKETFSYVKMNIINTAIRPAAEAGLYSCKVRIEKGFDPQQVAQMLKVNFEYDVKIITQISFFGRKYFLKINWR